MGDYTIVDFLNSIDTEQRMLLLLSIIELMDYEFDENSIEKTGKNTKDCRAWNKASTKMKAFIEGFLAPWALLEMKADFEMSEVK